MHCVHAKKLMKKGIKMFPSKTSRDVGWWIVSLMPLVAAWKNQLVEKVQKQGGLFHDCNNPVNIRCLQDTLWIHFHHPYIWQHFNAARLSVPVCFMDLNIY